MKQAKYTIADFRKQFPDDDSCLEWLKQHRYPDGIYCKTCEKITSHSKIKNIPVYSCNRCGAHTHPMAGTIFENSRTSLSSWFYAMFLMSATRCGISAKQLQREVGVTYKTAWRMFHQIRSLMDSLQQPMFGEIEIDETYIGGKSSGTRGRGAEGKTPVFGIAQRKGNISAKTVKNIKRSTLYPIIKEHVLQDSNVYTDEFVTYDTLSREGYNHERVNHALKQFVNGIAHTNTLEGFWSLLKRGISGVYHSVSEKHLQKYVNEYMFRYNHRKDEMPMFLIVLKQV